MAYREQEERNHHLRQASAEMLHAQSGKRLSIAEFVPYVVSGAAGLLTSWLSVGHQFYKNLKEWDIFKDALNTRDGKLKTYYADDSALKGTELRDAAKTAHKEFETTVDAYLKEKGLDTTIKKFGHLKPHQKWEAALTTATVTAVSLGALLSFMGREKEKFSPEQQALLQQLQANEQQR